VSALEDKVVQRAVVAILNQIYEAAFLGFSYGFRPGRSQHHALDALATGILRQPINWVLDLDVVRCFDSFDRVWLERFLQHRIGDRRLLRLIRKWLKAGVLEDHVVVEQETGVVQGAVVSPLLSNIYLHYVLDLWAHQWRRRHAQGAVIITRFADGTPVQA
jgi:retron-type reverse transcriptase